MSTTTSGKPIPPHPPKKNPAPVPAVPAATVPPSPCPPADGMPISRERMQALGEGDLPTKFRNGGIKVVDATPLPEAVDILDLLAADLLRPPEIVRGILHQGSKMVIGGGSKSFKTWSLLDLAISVATGVPWWGFETVKSRVLYINFEIQDPFFQDRVVTILEAKECALDRSQFLYLGLRGHAAKLGYLVPKLVGKFGAAELSLIIIDPIYKALGDRDENKAGDIAELHNEMDNLAVETNAAIAFGHHFSKGNQSGKEAMDRIGGSGVFARDPDAILTMTRHEEQDAFVVDATLRNFPQIDSFVVERRHPLMVRNEELDPKALKQAGPAKQKYTDAQLVEPLLENPMTTTEWQYAAMASTGISSSGFMNRRNDLLRKKYVHLEGKKWVCDLRFYDEKGRPWVKGKDAV